MKKNIEIWSTEDLENNYTTIDFPEYQREPTVWSRDAKQRLIDSMLRDFDISALYLYENEDGTLDCVDGRQRIGAIMSFLGKNVADPDNKFEYKVLNEVYEENSHRYAVLDGMKYKKITKRANEDRAAEHFVQQFHNYTLTIVKLQRSATAAEFNLQFARLNLGETINSGEKLHAMIGDLRDVCFGVLGSHDFLTSTNIPTRRYAKEQLAAQILAQVFALEIAQENGRPRDFARTRHYDIQRLFKQYSHLEDNQREWIFGAQRVMDLLYEQYDELPALRSRAMVLSTFLLAYELGVDDGASAGEVASFISEFARCVKWQMGKGLDMDDEYRYLADFHKNLTQASVEKAAVAARAEMLEEEFEYWRDNGELRGDDEFRENNPDKDPSDERIF